MEETNKVESGKTEQEIRGKFLKNYQDNVPKARRDIFEEYNQINSYELDLPNTQNKLVISVHQKKSDATDYLLKWQIGKSSMFIDAKTSWIVSEAMRFLTNEIVPTELKPKLENPKELTT